VDDVPHHLIDELLAQFKDCADAEEVKELLLAREVRVEGIRDQLQEFTNIQIEKHAKNQKLGHAF
jgi:hypothetical protein